MNRAIQCVRKAARIVVFSMCMIALASELSRLALSDDGVEGDAVNGRADHDVQAWELLPYRIAIWIQFDGDPVSHDLADRVAEFIESRSWSAVGGAWDLRIGAPPRKLPTNPMAWPEIVAANWSDEARREYDKLIILSVDLRGNEYRIAGREFDLTTGIWSASAERRVTAERQVASEAILAIEEVFSPLARIESIDEVVELRLRASRRWANHAAWWKGRLPMVFRPVLVEHEVGQSATDGVVRTPIPWTFLEPTRLSGSTLKCRLATALAGEAIPDYHPRRSRLALAVSVPQSPARLQLLSSDADGTPLVGYEIFDTSDDGQASRSLGLTGADGSLRIPSGVRALRWLTVRHGHAVLAQIPWVGDDPHQKLVIADDERRYAADRELQKLRDRILDASFQSSDRRSAILKKCRDDLARVEKQFAEPNAKLPTPITSMISSIRELLNQATADKKSR